MFKSWNGLKLFSTHSFLAPLDTESPQMLGVQPLVSEFSKNLSYSIFGFIHVLLNPRAEGSVKQGFLGTRAIRYGRTYRQTLVNVENPQFKNVNKISNCILKLSEEEVFSIQNECTEAMQLWGYRYKDFIVKNDVILTHHQSIKKYTGLLLVIQAFIGLSLVIYNV